MAGRYIFPRLVNAVYRRTVGGLLTRDGSTSHTWEADLMQAAYFLERGGILQLEAAVSRAKLYVDLQRMVNTGERIQADGLRGLVRAKEAEIVTLHSVADAILDRLIAVRSVVLDTPG